MKGWLSSSGVRTGTSRKTGGRRPDLRGGFTIGDQEFTASGWTSDDGRRISVRLTPREKGETVLINVGRKEG